jgi:hypothetical protein
MMTKTATEKEREESGLITGLFRDPASAESAYRSLRLRGYSDDEINIMMSEDTKKKYLVRDPNSATIGTKAAEGAGVGGAVGGTLGAILGAVAGIGTNLVLPGLGIVVWGPIAAALAGAGAGGLTGGVVGALAGWGIPEERARLYEKGLRQGGTVIGVRPKTAEDATYFEHEWAGNYQGEHIYKT